MRKFFIIILLIIFILSNTWAVSKVDFLSLNTKEDVSEKYMEKSDKTYTLLFTKDRAVHIGKVLQDNEKGIEFENLLGEIVTINEDNVKYIKENVKQKEVPHNLKYEYAKLYHLKLPVAFFNKEEIDFLLTKEDDIIIGKLVNNKNYYKIVDLNNKIYKFDKNEIKNSYKFSGMAKYILFSKLSSEGEIENILNESKKTKGNYFLSRATSPLILSLILIPFGLYFSMGTSSLTSNSGSYGNVGVLLSLVVVPLIGLIIFLFKYSLNRKKINNYSENHRELIKFLKSGEIKKISSDIDLNLKFHGINKNELSIGIGINF
ncbi:MAG: hypothetical protein FXF47_01815 [Candidatus Mcinerneyibacterium aminivorans]|uniref:Uncharacterized protein n=1 Tax=Candidatus Mcinerneyibacterium aminivorans TaxID=2703815 RepID=A0A5D0MKZ2_9BACT|nr:MAG: hypothetical protein FXF47_01815 [Candidatus Mcinerneyibacterium aminivorans]